MGADRFNRGTPIHPESKQVNTCRGIAHNHDTRSNAKYTCATWRLRSMPSVLSLALGGSPVCFLLLSNDECRVSAVFLPFGLKRL